VAQEVGLSLPHTLVTTDPARARAFVERQAGCRTVLKAFLASEQGWRETRLVRAEDMAKLETVRLAPVIFQEYVEGVDLRVTIVGSRIFTAEIDATRTSYPVDMRMVVGEADVRVGALPSALEEALLALMSRLGLMYGALDLRRRPDGSYVFFEVNPAGQWLFVEQRTGLPITDAVSSALRAMVRKR
jgi:glutathione synthase/RimK-type ligase-like ATP-grasp enzyme